MSRGSRAVMKICWQALVTQTSVCLRSRRTERSPFVVCRPARLRVERFFNGVKRTGKPVVNRAENPCRVGLWPAVGAQPVVLAYGVFNGVQAAKPPANS